MTENGKNNNTIEAEILTTHTVSQFHDIGSHQWELNLLKGIFLMLILLIWGMGTVLFLWIYPFKVIEFKKQPITIDKSAPIYAGDFVPVHWQYTKHVDTPSHVFVYLINTRQIILDDVWSARSRGTYDYIGSQVQIPMDIAPGKWRVRFVFTYELNPFRHESIKIETEDFEIKKKPPEVHKEADLKKK